MSEEYLEVQKEKLRAFFKSDEYVPMRAKDIALLLSVPREEEEALEEVLHSLEAEGEIVFTRKGKIMLAEELKLYVGVFSANARGFGFVRTENEKEDIFIPPSAKGGAIHGDKVQVRVRPSSGGRREGEIVKIISHKFSGIVGTYMGLKNYGFVEPDDKRFSEAIYIPSSANRGATSGSKVVVKIEKKGGKDSSPEGRITEILGHIDDPGVDILSIVKQYDIPVDFPKEVKDEAESIPLSLSPEDMEGRLDLRGKLCFTIDGEDAKDLDDAVSVEKLEDGGYRLGVYIADVSNYVKENSPLDKEALKRGTSVYLTDRVIPMLPHSLSNGICSLNQGEDRLALCCIMDINKKGDIINSDITKAVINVERRMSYTVVNDLLTNEESEYLKEYGKYLESFKTMEELRDILLAKREKRGAIEFEFDEAKIELDEKGKPVNITKRERNVATSIIEEFMLAANETVAERFYWLEIPFMYRTHEAPDEEKVEKLKFTLSKFGYSLKGNTLHPNSFRILLENIKGAPEEMLIQRLTLRSLKRACYSEQNGKHFGLAADYYCHFTSPIRRYPDLQIHRIISEFLSGTLSDKRLSHYKAILPKNAVLCSENERRADEAEKEADKYKMVEYMEDKVGMEFEGIISSVTNFGIFVELPNTIEGMIRPTSLEGDEFIYDEDAMSYVGSRSGRAYTVGDKINIIVSKADKEARTIDFDIVK